MRYIVGSSVIDLQNRINDLTSRVGVVYAHIDLEMPDRAELPEHDPAIADGPSSKYFAATLTLLFEFSLTQRRHQHVHLTSSASRGPLRDLSQLARSSMKSAFSPRPSIITLFIVFHLIQ